MIDSQVTVCTKLCTACGQHLPIESFFKYTDRRAAQRKTSRRRRSSRTADGRRAVCKACFAKLPSRSAAARQEDARAECQRDGRQYRTRAETHAASAQRRAETDAREAPVDVVMRRQLRTLLQRLFEQHCREDDQQPDAVQYKVRYRTDAAFRAREIARTWRRKEASGVLRTDHRSCWPVEGDGTLTRSVIQQLFAEANDCPYCGQWMHSRQRTLDHVIPVSRGGAHSITNVVVCCRSCNSRKGARSPEDLGWPTPPVKVLRRVSVAGDAEAREVASDSISSNGLSFSFSEAAVGGHD